MSDGLAVLSEMHKKADMTEEKNRIERSISSVASLPDFEKALDFVLRWILAFAIFWDICDKCVIGKNYIATLLLISSGEL